MQCTLVIQVVLLMRYHCIYVTSVLPVWMYMVYLRTYMYVIVVN